MSPPKPRGKRVLLMDVAREAGVSVQTASHVMSGNMTVRLPASTRKRVTDAAERVGYKPNRLAQAMQRGRTDLIGIWMPIDRLVFTYLRFLQAISLHARGTNYELMVTGLEGSTAYSGSSKSPAVWPVDGLIAVDAGKAVELFRADSTNDQTPVVVLGFEEFENSDSVTWDVAAATRSATERLISKGCRRIAHVTLDWIFEGYPRELRRRGYLEAMSAAGLEPIFIPVTGETSQCSAAGVGDYIDRHGCPDAFFGVTDTLAIGALNAVLERGLKVPQECKIWGFGDFPESAELRVTLSSIRVPVDAAVDQAWRWLVDRIENPQVEHRFLLMDMELIERDST